MSYTIDKSSKFFKKFILISFSIISLNASSLEDGGLMRSSDESPLEKLCNLINESKNPPSVDECENFVKTLFTFTKEDKLNSDDLGELLTNAKNAPGDKKLFLVTLLDNMHNTMTSQLREATGTTLDEFNDPQLIENRVPVNKLLGLVFSDDVLLNELLESDMCMDMFSEALIVMMLKNVFGLTEDSIFSAVKDIKSLDLLINKMAAWISDDEFINEIKSWNYMFSKGGLLDNFLMYLGVKANSNVSFLSRFQEKIKADENSLSQLKKEADHDTSSLSKLEDEIQSNKDLLPFIKYSNKCVFLLYINLVSLAIERFESDNTQEAISNLTSMYNSFIVTINCIDEGESVKAIDLQNLKKTPDNLDKLIEMYDEDQKSMLYKIKSVINSSEIKPDVKDQKPDVKDQKPDVKDQKPGIKGRNQSLRGGLSSHIIENTPSRHRGSFLYSRSIENTPPIHPSGAKNMIESQSFENAAYLAADLAVADVNSNMEFLDLLAKLQSIDPSTSEIKFKFVCLNGFLRIIANYCMEQMKDFKEYVASTIVYDLQDDHPLQDTESDQPMPRALTDTIKPTCDDDELQDDHDDLLE